MDMSLRQANCGIYDRAVTDHTKQLHASHLAVQLLSQLLQELRVVRQRGNDGTHLLLSKQKNATQPNKKKKNTVSGGGWQGAGVSQQNK